MGKIVTIASVTLSWDRCAPFPFCTESALSKLIGMYILSTAYGALSSTSVHFVHGSPFPLSNFAFSSMYYHYSRTRILLTSDPQVMLMPASSLSRPWITTHAHRTSHFIFFTSRARRSPARMLTSRNLPACSSHSRSLLYSTATRFPHVFRCCSIQQSFVLFVDSSYYVHPPGNLSFFFRRHIVHPPEIFHFVLSFR